MDESLTTKFLHLLVFLAICAGIILLGWNEPLRYRFMSPQEIAELENPPATPAPTPPPPWIDTRKTPTKLNEMSHPGRGLSAPPRSALDR